jgi:kynureninase
MNRPTTVPSSQEEELLALREQFPILQKTTYLISHSLGAMPQGVHDSLQDYATQWAERGIRAWAEGWWEMTRTTGDVLAEILDAEPGSIVMHQNVSVCQSLLASCFSFDGPRNKVVYTSLNFPSVMYVWEARRREGARIVEVPSPDGMTVPTQAVVDAIDEETLLVPISHVLYKSAYLQDVKAIIEKAHSVGARVVLDCYQSTGTVPFSLRDLQADFATGGSVKWLCGGPGAGYLYVRPDLRDQLQPKVTGWMAHADPFAFEPGAIRYADDGFRFLHGSPAVPAMFAALPGYRIIRQLGVERIRAKSQRQTELLRQEALERGMQVTSPENPAQRGGTITVAVDQAAAVVRALAEREILLDYRPGAGIRISPHFYTSDEELRFCLDSIQEIQRSGSHEKFLEGGAAY